MSRFSDKVRDEGILINILLFSANGSITLIVYFQLIMKILKTDTDVSAAQTMQGGQLRNSLNALSFLGGIDSVFCQTVAYNFQLRPR